MATKFSALGMRELKITTTTPSWVPRKGIWGDPDVSDRSYAGIARMEVDAWTKNNDIQYMSKPA